MKHIGRAVPALNNRVLVSGRGQFVGDVDLPGMCAIALVRSPYAHAKIVSINTGRAEAVPGVVAILTGEEIARNTNKIPAAADPGVYGGRSVSFYALPTDRVRFVGEAIAAVVAEDRYTANQARDLIEVIYDELPVVANVEQALKHGAELVEPTWPDNVMMHKLFERGDVVKELQRSENRLTGSVKAHRYVASPIETRAYAGSYDPYQDQLTVWSSTQNPHPLRVFVAETLGISENSVRVIQPHVGGGFGQKVPPFPEEIIVAYLARKLGRPVKWIEERTEHFLSAGHAREELIKFEVAYRNDGRITGLSVQILADVGAPSTLVGWAMSYVSAYCVPTCYKIDNCRVELFSLVTNKCPWNGYRAFGKEAASYLMERIVDRVADATGIGRVEVRLKNFIQPEDFPYSQVSGAVLDSGDYPRAMRRLLELVDVGEFRREQAEARKKGRFLGLGVGFELTPEGCSLPNSTLLSGYDGATVRVSPTGQVTVLTGVTSPGSGNETGIAQIVADTLGASLESVRVIQGDTQTCPYGLGNYSSRSLMIGGSAARNAAEEIRKKMFKIAARSLEVLPDDLTAEDNYISVKDAPGRKISLREVASLVYTDSFGKEALDEEPGLEATRYYRIGNVYHQPEVQGRFSAYPTWPYAACAAVVDVDPETGIVKVLRFAVVHDAGPVINPLLADANLQGAVAQGLGGTLYEHIVYDEAAQLLTATLMDYTLPTAVEVPNTVIDHLTTPSPFTQLGIKGVGESGITGPTVAVPSAVEDALSHLKLSLMENPLTPERVWQAVRAAQAT
jgi:carbon-monoxide dehydrogenase large subunit